MFSPGMTVLEKSIADGRNDIQTPHATNLTSACQVENCSQTNVQNPGRLVTIWFNAPSTPIIATKKKKKFQKINKQDFFLFFVLTYVLLLLLLYFS